MAAIVGMRTASNNLASSASVFSPLIAAKATFALKPGLCVRRVRFVMFAPDPRQHRRCQAGNPPIALSELREPPLTDMALSELVRRMNEKRPDSAPPPWRDADGRGAVPHGFRATFSTWVDDTRPEERETVEKALAHEIGNKVFGGYRRSDVFARRVALMQNWADHCIFAVGVPSINRFEPGG